MSKKNEDPSPEDLGFIPQPPETDPATQPEPSPPETGAPKRRGRPPGSKNAPSKSASKKSQDVEDFAKQIQGIHALIAMATGLPELNISEQEARMLSKGLSAVAEEYGLDLTGKTGAAMQLFGAAAIVYVPRALAIKARIAKQKSSENADGPEISPSTGAR